MGVLDLIFAKGTPTPLTDATIRNAKAKDKPYKLADTEGMYLLIAPIKQPLSACL